MSGALITPSTGFLFIINAAFIVNSSLLLIYEDVPSIGSINQKLFKFSFFLLEDVSSDIIGISGVSVEIFFVNILLTSISPFVTGVLSDLISFFNPFFLNSKATLPASLKVSSKESAISFL